MVEIVEILAPGDRRFAKGDRAFEEIVGRVAIGGRGNLGVPLLPHRIVEQDALEAVVFEDRPAALTGKARHTVAREGEPAPGNVL